MTQHNEQSTEAAEKMARSSRAFVDEGKERVATLAAAQSEFMDCLQNIGRGWTERLRLEASLGADIAQELTSSRSLKDTSGALQNWASRHIELAADDTRRLLTDSQQIMEAGARFWTHAGRVARPSEGRGLMS